MGIGENIKQLRLEHHETQGDLAAAIGYTPMAISQWENERAVPRMGAIELLAAHWGVPKSRIVMGSDEMDDPAIWAMPLADDERKLVVLFRALNDEGRAKLLDLADDLKASGKYRRRAGDGAQVRSA